VREMQADDNAWPRCGARISTARAWASRAEQLSSEELLVVDAAELLGWRPGVGLVPAQDAREPLLVADSWLLEDGTVRGLDLHEQRFRSSCTTSGLDPDEVTEFWHALRDRLPRTGVWFPRAELVTGAGLRLRLRPAPPRTSEVNVLVHTGPDTRQAPRRKGPDLDRLGALRQRAIEAGANEALLVTPSGFVLEGATSSLLWWEDEDVLCAPDTTLRVLPGVTTELLRRAALARGITVRRRRARLAELAGREAWLVNALHGIRPVRSWVGSAVPAGAPTRADAWRQWWSELAEALPAPAITLPSPA
jgi:branched-subunit amino acid aminotransferase/4-amino-4-deoxychorismate lyase